MMEGIRNLLERFMQWTDDLLFPENVTCLCCDRALCERDEGSICAGCHQALEQLSARQEECEAMQRTSPVAGLDYIHAAYVYEGPARELIHKLKYESVRAAAIPLAWQMAFLPSGEEEIIVPVPTDKRRERRRGFNQSALLAQHIAKELGMPMETALVRVQARRPQTGLSLQARKQNLVGCMKAGQSVAGKRVLLVDDVCTTGATLEEAARALYAAGAKSVGAFTAARAQADPDGRIDPFIPASKGAANREND